MFKKILLKTLLVISFVFTTFTVSIFFSAISTPLCNFFISFKLKDFSSENFNINWSELEVSEISFQYDNFAVKADNLEVAFSNVFVVALLHKKLDAVKIDGLSVQILSADQVVDAEVEQNPPGAGFPVVSILALLDENFYPTLEEKKISVGQFELNGELFLSPQYHLKGSFLSENLLNSKHEASLVGSLELNDDQNNSIASEIDLQSSPQEGIHCLLNPTISYGKWVNWSADLKMALTKGTQGVELIDLQIQETGTHKGALLCSVAGKLDVSEKKFTLETTAQFNDQSALFEVLDEYVTSLNADLENEIEVDLESKRLTSNLLITADVLGDSSAFSDYEISRQLKAHANFKNDFDFNSQQLEVAKLKFEIFDKKLDEDIILIEQTEPLLANLQSLFNGGLPEIDGLDMSIAVHHLPFAWTSVFFPDYIYSGDAIEAAFLLTQPEDVFVFKPVGPLVVNNFELKVKGEEWFKGIDFNFSPFIEVQPGLEEIYLREANLLISNNQSSLFDLGSQVKISLSDKKLKLIEFILISDLTPINLLNQPIFKDRLPVVPAEFHSVKSNLKGVLTRKDLKSTILQLNTFEVYAHQNDNPKSLEIYIREPVALTYHEDHGVESSVDGELLFLKLREFDYTWVNIFDFGFDIRGRPLDGDFTLVHEDGAFSWGSEEAFEMKSVNSKRGAREITQAVDFMLNHEAYLEGTLVKAAIDSFSLSSNGERLLEGDLDFSNSKLLHANTSILDKLTLSEVDFGMEVDIPKIFSQPIGAGFEAPTNGSASVLFNGGSNRGWFGEIQIKDLIFPHNEAESVEASIVSRLDKIQDGVSLSGSADASTWMNDETVNFEWTGLIGEPEQNLMHYDISIDGEVFDMPAILAIKERAETEYVPPAEPEEEKKSFFGGWFGGDKDDEPKAVAKKSSDEESPFQLAPINLEADKQPFWAGHGGRLILDFESIMLSEGLFLNQTQLEANLKPEEMSLNHLESMLVGESLIKVESVLKFDPEDLESPYVLNSTMSLDTFNLSDYLLNNRPLVSKLFRGQVEGEMQVEGSGPNLDALLRRAQGTVQAKSIDGYFSLLGIAGEEVVKFGGRVNNALKIAKVALLFKPELFGDKKEKVEALSTIISVLNGFSYDELLLNMRRTEDLKVYLDQVKFKSSSFVIELTGFMELDENLEFADKPMEIDLQFRLEGKLIEEFVKLGFKVESEEGEDGLRLGPSFKIKGTPSKPDWSSFIEPVTKSLDLPSLGSIFKK